MYSRPGIISMPTGLSPWIPIPGCGTLLSPPIRSFLRTHDLAGKTVVNSISFPVWLLPVSLVCLGVAILTAFKPKLARFTGPVYALAMGAVAGAISQAYNVQFSGIIVQAVALTVAVLGIMTVLYTTRTIRVTDKLRTGIIAATGAVFLVYLVAIFARLIFDAEIPFLNDSGAIGIGISLVIVGIAAMNLLLDFDIIERGIQMRAPKYMEWYAAFSLMVTLIWLYLEILRLLSKLRD